MKAKLSLCLALLASAMVIIGCSQQQQTDTPPETPDAPEAPAVPEAPDTNAAAP